MEDLGGRSRRRRRLLALLLLIPIGLLVAGSEGYAWWLCNDAIYHCPAEGCGDVPQQNCQNGGALAAWTTTIGVSVMVAIVGTVVWSLYRDGHLRARPIR